MGQAQIQRLERLFNRNEAVLARWKSGDGMLAGLLAGDARLARAAEWMVLRVSWSDSAAERGMHALEILAHGGSINRITPHHHAVLSLSNPSRRYNVTQRRCNWSCDCPDHLHRKAHCKHILAVACHVVEREEAALGMPDARGSGCRDPAGRAARRSHRGGAGISGKVHGMPRDAHNQVGIYGRRQEPQAAVQVPKPRMRMHVCVQGRV